MPKAKNVTVIPATLNIHTKTPTKERVRRRVAAYARVSTDSEGERKCETPHLTEERLKELYLAALGEYLSDRDAAIDQLRYAQRMLTDTDFIDADIQALEEELTTITGMLRLCIAENAANTMTEETYIFKYRIAILNR